MCSLVGTYQEDLTTTPHNMDVDATYDYLPLPEDKRVVVYDPLAAMETLLRMKQHNEDTMDALNVACATPTSPDPASKWPPPDWKGCSTSYYCIRECGEYGKHLTQYGRPGGRGGCCLREAPESCQPPSDCPTFEEARNKRKRGQQSPPPEQETAPTAKKTTRVAENKADTPSEAKKVVAQAAAEAAAAEAAAVQVPKAADPSSVSDIETLRALVTRLEARVQSLEEFKARQIASWVAMGN